MCTSTRCAPAPPSSAAEVLAAARALRINLRDFGDGTVGVALDETVTPADLDDLLAVFGASRGASELASSFEPPPLPGSLRPRERLSGPSRLQFAPLRNRDAAVHSPLGVPRPLSHHQHDPSGLMHDEAERDHPDDPGDVARIRRTAPLCAAGPGGRVRTHRRGACGVAWRDLGTARRLAAAQFGSAGRIHGAAGDPGAPASARPGAPGRLPDPVVGPRHQPPRAPSWLG